MKEIIPITRLNQHTWPFLRYYKDFENLIFWVLSVWLAMHTKIDSINLQESLMYICMQKIKFIPHLFLEILIRYCKLVILGALVRLATATKNDSINLWETLIFIFIQKNQIYPHFFLEILHSKESCHLICREHFGS